MLGADLPIAFTKTMTEHNAHSVADADAVRLPEAWWLEHQGAIDDAIVEKGEASRLNRSGGALVRYTNGNGITRLVRPDTYFSEIGGPDSDVGNCDRFSPVLTIDEVQRNPPAAARRVAGFVRLLAEIIASARTNLTKT